MVLFLGIILKTAIMIVQDTDIKGNNKKSSLLYHDYLVTVERLENEKAGMLFKRILNFLNGKDVESEDALVELAFAPLKQQFLRDNQKYLDKCEKNRQNVKRRWDKTKSDTNAYDRIRPVTNHTDTDTDTDTDIKSEYLKDIMENKIHASWGAGIRQGFDLKAGKVKELLSRFDGHYISSSTEHKTVEDYKHHFKNWLFKEKRSGNLKVHQKSREGML